jgi:tetratricopeptide (TPR) repeat protein
VTLAPDERAAVEQRPTANLAALLEYGHGARLEILGDYRAAEQAFRRAVRLDPHFRAARARASEARRLAEAGVTNPLLVPGVRAIDAAVGSTIDRLNRPFDFLTRFGSPGSRTSDPTFFSSTATVVITVNRP